MQTKNENASPIYRVTRNGYRVLAKPPPADITVDRNGNPLTKEQIRRRKRQLTESCKRTVTRAEYSTYIRSDAWKATKIRYLKSNMPKDCWGCAAPWASTHEFHHRTYKNLGNERLMDIMPMCRACHQKVHDRYDANPKDGLWAATKWVHRTALHKKRKMRKEASREQSRKARERNVAKQQAALQKSEAKKARSPANPQ